MLDDGESLIDVWRHGVIQLLDDYESTRRHDGLEAAADLLREAPALMGEPRVDAALAGLVEYLARRDGWPPPRWVRDSERRTDRWWFVTPLRGIHPRALVESPLSFRKRGVFITSGALERV